MISIAVRKELQGAAGTMLLDVSFDVAKAAIVALTGHSGAGKTSILKMIAGLMQPGEGQIAVAGEIWFDSRQSVNRWPQKRNIGFVFQQYALFPNMRVLENLTYALPGRQDYPMIEEVLAMMDIADLQQQYPINLSGGQQQRVALARAIIRKPQILLLDEPFAALDRAMRNRLQQDLLQIHARYHTTTLIVSHDTSEVAHMADQVIVLDNGRIAKQGTPWQVLPRMSPDCMEGEVIAIDHANQRVVLAIPHALGYVTVSSAILSSAKKGDYLRIPLKDQINPGL